MTDLDHRCRSGATCVDADTKLTDDDGHTIRRGKLITEGLLCDGCYVRLGKAVKYIARDWLRLSNHLGSTGSADLNDRVGGTREQPIPLNVQVEAMMSRLVELAERALAMVGKPVPARVGRSNTSDRSSLERAVKYVPTRLDILLATPATETLAWSKIPTGDSQWDPDRGQPVELVAMSGLDIAADIVHVNRRVGQLLGKDRLRHHYALPCPSVDRRGHYCGAMTVGRDDGEARVDCTTCGASWTEREYDFLSGLVLDEIKVREENDLLRWLLAEAYWRLDSLQIRDDALGEQWDQLTDQIPDLPPDAVIKVLSVIREQLAGVLTDGEAPHPRPDQRMTATPKAAR